MEISQKLVNADYRCDFVPLVSTVSNIVALFIKTVVIPFLSERSVINNRYLCHLSVKETSRCLILLVPVFGNLYVWLDERKRVKEWNRLLAEESKNETDIQKKLNALQNAAARNNPEASYALAKFLTTDKRLAGNKETVIFHLRKAASSGHVGAMLDLAAIHYKEKDYEKSVYWNRLAEEKGSLEAVSALGTCYWYGHGVPKNEEEAIKCWEKAEDSVQEACYNLGRTYYFRSSIKAIDYWLKGADRGDPDACIMLSECYRDGWNGMDKDLELADSFKKRGEELEKKALLKKTS